MTTGTHPAINARQHGAPPASIPTFFDATVGKKMVMALTGGILFIFIVIHLMGNLLIFWGRDELNAYARFLKVDIVEELWIARAVLLVALFFHVLCSVRITITNWSARPVPYSFRQDVATNYAARTMIISGPLILLYAIYHLLMFTFLLTGPGYSPTDVYANEIAAFGVPVIAFVYIVAMLMLGMHLYHGFWSMLHTGGVSNPRYKRLRYILSPAVAIAITAGYISIPVAVLTGLVR